VPYAVHQNTKERTPDGTGTTQFDAEILPGPTRFHPPRSELPARAVAVEDTLAIAEEELPTDSIPQPEILWETPEIPSHMDTWREARYAVHCEGLGGPFVDINGATGGLVARVMRPGSGCTI
jgi:hypothetical protein